MLTKIICSVIGIGWLFCTFYSVVALHDAGVALIFGAFAAEFFYLSR